MTVFVVKRYPKAINVTPLDRAAVDQVLYYAVKPDAFCLRGLLQHDTSLFFIFCTASTALMPPFTPIFVNFTPVIMIQAEIQCFSEAKL